MNYQQVKQSQHNISSEIIQRKIHKAISALKTIMTKADDLMFNSELSTYEDTYKNMLKYSFEYGNDPQREKVYMQLCRNLLELSDKMHQHILYKNKTDIAFQTNIDVPRLLSSDESEKMTLVNELIHECEINSLMNESGTKKEESFEPGMAETNLEKIFNFLAFSNHYNDIEMAIAQKLIHSDVVTKKEKSLLVAAVFVSLLRIFEEKKCTLLFEIIDLNQDIVSHRALLSLLMILFLYESRLVLYPSILNRLKSAQNSDQLTQLAEDIVLQYIKATDTDRISKKIQDEIIPEVIKMKDDLEDKLNLNDLLKEKSFEDENPDWKEFFGNAPDVYKKFEEFSMMQLEGNDVYMSAFSMLKNFPFFQHISNWFLVFNAEHSEIKKALHKLGDPSKYKSFIDGLSNSSILCNSDKYSFCFNIQFMPELQQNMMMEMFNMEMKAMNDLEKEENKHFTKNKDRIIFTQYLQDLFRFHKLHPLKSHITNIFTQDIPFEKSMLVKELLSNESLRKIGELYFSKGYYQKAIAVFEELNKSGDSMELLEKIAFSYQKLQQYSKALTYYKQAEILDTKKPWLLKKIAFCLKNLSQIEEAISYYHRIELLEPDKEENQIYMGNLLLENKQFEEALKYYFKVEYSNPDTIKVLRPIGWCYFVSGKPDKAINYFLKVTTSKSATKNDFINLGHAYWVSGKLTETIENYRKAYELSKKDFSWFTKVLDTDKDHLFAYKIDEIEINLIADYISIDTF